MRRHDSCPALCRKGVGDTVLLLKLTIVPLALLALGLVERRHGPRLAGWLAGIPVVAGPLLVFVTLSHGAAFGAHAALGAWFGIVPWLGFANTYSLTARWWHWTACALAASLVWLALAYAMVLAQDGPTWLEVLPLIAYLGAVLAYPRHAPAQARHVGSSITLPARMAAGAGLTLAITQFSGSLGPLWSGTLTVFPVMGSIIAISNHIQYGRHAVEEVLAGMSMGLSSVGTFSFTLHALLAHWHPLPAFALALAAGSSAHAATFLLVRRMRKPAAQAIS